MKIYHWTSAAAARAILKAGFRTGQGSPSSVWVSDSPLDATEDVIGAGVVELYCPATLFAEYEWIENAKLYREALIPATRLNTEASIILRRRD